jgi:hypothetical protein
MSQLITKGYLSTQIISKGYYGRFIPVISGLVKITLSLATPSIPMIMTVPTIPMTMTVPKITLELKV